jgi:2-oxoglutarate ferredoxin oxidoreductase subunit gamma
MPKRIEVRISGLGGQGVVLVGQILGRAAIYDEKYAIQTQSYGAEARGSAAKSEVIISDDKVWFPMVRKCDILVTMSQGTLKEHLADLKENGTLLVDEHMVKEVPPVNAKVFRIPATKVAENELKSGIYANVVMLGALVGITGIVTVKAVEKAIGDAVPQEYLEKNLKGFKKGLELVG